jgi:hypothetical protein
MNVNSKMTAIADKIRAKTGETEKLNLDQIEESIDEVYELGVSKGKVPFGVSFDVFNSSGNLVKCTYFGDDVINNAFREHSVLKTIKFQDDITRIGNYAFYGCKVLDIYAIPKTVSYIGGGAFVNNKALTAIIFEGTPESMGANIFSGCDKLTVINVPWSETASVNTNAPWGAANAIINYDMITELNDNITEIEQEEYSNRTDMGIALSPSSLETIGHYAFGNCPYIKFRTIPKSVKSIGNMIFSGCPLITKITFEGTPEEIGVSALYNGPNGITIINVPWSEGEVANAPWGAMNATINYNYTEE